MEEYEGEVELIDYIEVLLKRKRLIIGGTVLCALAAGFFSLSSPRGFEAQALIVVSPTITGSARGGGEGEGGWAAPGAAEIIVPGLAATTYEALATGDELLTTLRDSLLGQPLPASAAQLITGLGIDGMLGGFVSAELVKETAKAESPLLSFRVTSAEEALPVTAVNLWAKLFVERHRGMSSNVADDYYQWVLAQYDVSKAKLERTEGQLTEVTSTYNELSVLQAEIAARSSRLGTALTTFQELETDLEAKEREWEYVTRQLKEVTFEGKWLGYLDAARRETLRHNGPSSVRSGLLAALSAQEAAIRDSVGVRERQDSRRREAAAYRDGLLLEFERDTGIERLRGRFAEVASSLGSCWSTWARRGSPGRSPDPSRTPRSEVSSGGTHGDGVVRWDAVSSSRLPGAGRAPRPARRPITWRGEGREPVRGSLVHRRPAAPLAGRAPGGAGRGDRASDARGHRPGGAASGAVRLGSAG